MVTYAGQTHVDNGNDIASSVVELGHVHIEVVQLVLLCLAQDDSRSVTDGMDAAQICCRVQRGIWCTGDVDFRDRGIGRGGDARTGVLLGETRGFQAAVCRGSVGVDTSIGSRTVTAAFTAEQAHCGRLTPRTSVASSCFGYLQMIVGFLQRPMLLCRCAVLCFALLHCAQGGTATVEGE